VYVKQQCDRFSCPVSGADVGLLFAYVNRWITVCLSYVVGDARRRDKTN